MKCKNCDGTGKVVNPMMSMNGDEYTGEWEQHECEACNGTGKVPMTNEEWLRQCTTEQLAEFLCNVGFENETIVRKFKSEWIEWLKEKHNDSMSKV